MFSRAMVLFYLPRHRVEVSKDFWRVSFYFLLPGKMQAYFSCSDFVMIGSLYFDHIDT